MLVDKKRFGQYLAQARLNAGLSQGELAGLLGYESPQFVSNWERGLANPPLDRLPKLAKAVGLSIDSLIELIVSETQIYLQSEFQARGRKRKRA